MRLRFCAVLLAGCLTANPGLAQDAPQTVTLSPGMHRYFPAGEFLSGGKSVSATPVTVQFDDPLTIMKYQVGAADYALCVADGGCAAPFRGSPAGQKIPATGVSFKDASDYAQWLSDRTGERWRLPSDAEWSYAAGSKFSGEIMQLPAGKADPAKDWIANYKRMAAEFAAADPAVHETGAFGLNENGISDIAGNVWEWTSSCYFRATLEEDGALGMAAENCGVRVVEGRHRTYITDFVQDAAGGGCSVGSPPDHLGFRLVRDKPSIGHWLGARLRRLID
jgi:formylglycine-generating enzyme required for sulfatase activity